MPSQPTSPNDISDIRPDSGNGQVSPTQLPIRGEKRIIPAPINPSDLAGDFTEAYTASGNAPPTYEGTGTRTAIVQESDFYVTAALRPFIDYIVIRVAHRGITASKEQNGNAPATYRFLINPAQVAINRTTIDGQAMTRAGWQIGVWGEDVFQVTLTGKTAGQYFAFGITDGYQQFTESYRNLEMLQIVFENNGYWFEGEQAAEGPLAADFTRRRIKMHADVELTVGNFIWSGMFDSLTITQSAEEPWLASFNIVFTVWKERFRSTSPYQNSIANNVERGHSYSAGTAALPSTANGIPQNAATPQYSLLPPTMPAPPTAPQPSPVAPAISAALADNLLPQSDPQTVDSSPTSPILNRATPANFGAWQGALGPVAPLVLPTTENS